jgi:hypothetical protein
MEQTMLARALRVAASAAIPDDADLWPSLKARVGTKLVRQPRPALGTIVTRRRMTLALIGATVALVPGLGLATPLGENTFGKFVQRFGLVLVPSTTLPGPPPLTRVLKVNALATPPAGQPETHLIINGVPVTPGTVPTPPAKLGPGKAAVFFALRLDPIPLDQAQKQVHFTVRAPTWLPAGLSLKGALVTPGPLSGGGAVSAVASTNPGASIHVERSSGVVAIGRTTDHAVTGTPVAGVAVEVGTAGRPAVVYSVDGTPVAGDAGPNVIATTGSPGRLVASDIPTSLTIVYTKNGATDARLQVTESEAGKAMGMIVPESAALSLTVGGHPATYARGKWQPGSGDPPSGMQWDSTVDDGVLSWDDGGVTYVVWSSGLGLSRNDLIRIGESLK